MELTKILIMAVVSCLLTVIVGQYKPEYSLLIRLVSVLLVCSVALGQVYDVILDTLSLTDRYGLNKEYIYILLKAVIIAIVGKVVCDICVDSGNKAIATCVELVCQLAIILLAKPLIFALSGIASELIQ